MFSMVISIHHVEVRMRMLSFFHLHSFIHQKSIYLHRFDVYGKLRRGAS